MTYLKLYAPAKVNLFLRVVGKLPSGFHEIISLITPVTLHDDIELTIDFAKETWIIRQEYSPKLEQHVGYLKDHCQHVTMAEDGMRGDANLAYRAAGQFCNTFKNLPKFGGNIVIHKRIPFGAGMGGGSSDAAAVIRGLCGYFRIPLSHPQVQQIAGVLGSDVFALLDSKPCLVRGRGEVVTPLFFHGGTGREAGGKCSRAAPRLASSCVLVLKPPLSVPTADAYRWLGLASPLPNKSPIEMQNTLSDKLPNNSPNWTDPHYDEILSRWGFTISRDCLPTGSPHCRGGELLPMESSGIAGSQSGEDEACGVEHRMCFNDIETAVFDKIEVLRDARDYLLSTSAQHVLLSGSGSAMFAIFSTFHDATRAETFFLENSSYCGWFIGIEKFFNLL